MTKAFSYTDAAKLLGGRENRILASIDKLMGGILFASAAAGHPFALGLFEAKSELLRLSGELVSDMSEKLAGLSAADRTERLSAAHAIIVVTAYFEALKNVRLPFNSAELQFTKSEQTQLASRRPADTDNLVLLAQDLLTAKLPSPVPQQPYEVTLELLLAYYTELSARTLNFITGLAIWDRLNETEKARVSGIVKGEVPKVALQWYEHFFRQLAVQFPEIAFRENLIDHQATREVIKQLSIDIQGLARVLDSMQTGMIPDERLGSLVRHNHSVLNQPILDAQQLPVGDLHVPSLEQAYINPNFRFADAGASDRPDHDSWWKERPVRSDLHGFLLGYLTSERAVEAPIMVLGQPGSGKSLLTKVLAGHLLPSGFLTIRVALSEAPIEADLQTQIEWAIRSATGESVPWPELARSAGGALPVILLDGFDELLQATGVTQSDYLETIVHFQEREASVGRSMVVLVTSRTVVADRVRIPNTGIAIVRLEPYSQEQIGRWLNVWNETNASYLTSHGLSELTVKTVSRNLELAVQPLLLLMLALYDSTDNALQKAEGNLGQAELYDRLLTSFTEREVRKAHPELDDAGLHEVVNQHLLRLSIAAFSMFNRNHQWITNPELEQDLATLLPNSGKRSSSLTGFRAPLSAAELTIGRFFFIHEPQAMRGDTRITATEFLHATFGEYLVARLVKHELDHLARIADLNADNTRRTELDDGFLHALLSFVPLTVRATVVGFLHELTSEFALPRRQVLSGLLLTIFNNALRRRTANVYDDYRPADINLTQQCATYSCNVLLLITMVRQSISGRELLSNKMSSVYEWTQLTSLWRSQLSPQGWASLLDALDVRRIWHEDNAEIEIALDPEILGDLDSEPDYYDFLFSDAEWSIGFRRGKVPDAPKMKGGRPGGAIWTSQYLQWLREAAFICDSGNNLIAHLLDALSADIASGMGLFADIAGRKIVSMTHAIVKLWLASSSDFTEVELLEAYDTCIDGFLCYPTQFSLASVKNCRTIVVHLLSRDIWRLPKTWRESTRAKLVTLQSDDWVYDTELLEWISELARILELEMQGGSPPQQD